MRNLSRIGFATVCVFLSLIVLFVRPLLFLASAATATRHFEVYCDGVGLFLTKIDGAPASGKLVLFSRLGQTFSGEYLGQGKWSDVYVFRDGCVPDGKCESIADGKVWIDATDEQHTQPKHIAGKYEINLNDKHLEGTFLAKLHVRRRLLRLCM
jgi:hypothetical protein